MTLRTPSEHDRPFIRVVPGADLSHHAHCWANFRVLRFDGSSATMCSQAKGLAQAHDGRPILTQISCRLDAIRKADGGKFTSFAATALMPLPATAGSLHGRRRPVSAPGEVATGRPEFAR